MEIGLEAAMPTYAGGLGVLAGDTIRAAADLQVPMVAMTLLHRHGYFYQHLDDAGRQTEAPVQWDVDDFLSEMTPRVTVTLEGRSVNVRAWRYTVRGIGGHEVPVYFLDTDLAENDAWDRTLTDSLYGNDARYRFCQEAVLGIGGVRMLQALGHNQIARYHLNEGHSALLTLELLDQEAKRAGRPCVSRDDIHAIRHKCVFTTHTPVPAGHDQFPMELVKQVLGAREDYLDLKDVYCADLARLVLRQGAPFGESKNLYESGDLFNPTYLALNLSHYVNGVAKKHGEVARMMFGGYHIEAITNGVHAATWVAPPLQELYDRHISGWRQDNFSLRSALSIPADELWQAHQRAKKALMQYVNHETNAGLEVDALTLGFARRATEYKRADLLFADLERLRAMGHPLQVIYAGKAHPQDAKGKELIQQIFKAAAALRPLINVVYLQNYDLELAKLLTAGVDVWLNTPQPPLEASGTSGMKASLNGVPSLSVLDGWWIEGHIEGVTGWAIGENHRAFEKKNDEQLDRRDDANALYDKLERVIVPQFYGQRERFQNVMQHCIALNGSFFNAQRMMMQYVLNAYFL
ncbi:MAG: alpha-glucan family phosphorylase [Acidobacteria bacterium]|nr:alpha-glucan family phosphorylase [Acidobacteriota bacterium]